MRGICRSTIAVLLALSAARAGLAGDGEGAAVAPLRVPVKFSAPGPGFVSLALSDEGGVHVRTLLSASPVAGGEQVVSWDGTTDLGKPVAAGTYKTRGIFFATPPALAGGMIVGKSGNPTWRTPDGKGDWGGNLGFPSSIASDGEALVLAYAAVEDNQITGIQRMGGEGDIRLRYFSFYPWDVRMAAAMDRAGYYLGILNAEKKQIEIAQYAPGEPRGKILVALPTLPHEDRSETRWRGRFVAWLDGLALTDDTIFASIGADDALFIIDRATGAIRERVALPSPRGLAVSGGRLLAISGRKVLRLSPGGRVEATVVEEGELRAPNALAVDGEGNLYVGDGGPTGEAGEPGSRQVHVFSPEGTPLRRIGKPGGTPREGRFDEDGLGRVTSLCIGPGEGGAPALWINDIATGFPRTSRWSLDGKLQRQWFGRKLTLFSDVINPSRPRELIVTADAFADEPGISAYEFDLDKKTWRPSWHYDTSWADMYQEDVYLSFEHGGNPLAGPRGKDARWPVFEYNSRHFVTHAGRHYFMNEGGNGDSAIFQYGPDLKPRPVALIGNHRSAKGPGGRVESFYDQGPNNWFTWADRDGDGRMAPAEILFTENPASLAGTSRLSEAHLGADLTVTLKRFAKGDDGKPRLVDSVLPLKELLPGGIPVYDWGQLRDLTPLQPPDLTGGDGTKEVGLYAMPIPLEAGGALYSMVKPESTRPLDLPGIDGTGWWAGRNWRTKVARFDKATGKATWAVGRRAPARAEPGQMYHPAWLAGVAGGAVFVTDTLGPVWVWDTDGLFLGHIYHDFGSGIQDDQTLYGEIQATAILDDPESGKIYAIANDTGAHIHEVTLPKRTPLEASAIRLGPEEAARATPWDPDGPPPTEKPSYLARYLPAHPHDFPLKIDGDFDGREGWGGFNDGAKTPEMLVLLDGQRLATVRVLFDDENLYLGYDVAASSGPANAGSELPFAPFVSGAYVDFTLGKDWDGPRAEVREGDLRAILARVSEGGGTVDFQQGFWPRKRGGTRPQTIASPAASLKFDEIAPLPGLKMAYKVGREDSKSKLIPYQVEVAVPLASLGLENPAGKTVGFDASVGVASAAGDRRERAAHWAGASEAVVVDRPGSARLIPDTWGTLRFEPKPPAR